MKPETSQPVNQTTSQPVHQSTSCLPTGGPAAVGEALKSAAPRSEVAGRAELLIKFLSKLGGEASPPSAEPTPAANLSPRPTVTNSYRGTATIWGHLGSPNATPKRHLESCWNPLGPKSGHHEPKYIQKGHLELHWGSLTSENTVKHIGISLFP